MSHGFSVGCCGLRLAWVCAFPKPFPAPRTVWARRFSTGLHRGGCGWFVAQGFGRWFLVLEYVNAGRRGQS